MKRLVEDIENGNVMVAESTCTTKYKWFYGKGVIQETGKSVNIYVDLLKNTYYYTYKA